MPRIAGFTTWSTPPTRVTPPGTKLTSGLAKPERCSRNSDGTARVQSGAQTKPRCHRPWRVAPLASKFTLRDLKSRGSQQQSLADFEDYLNGFSQNVQDI